MSIYGMMRTSISGMASQAARLTAVSDNIANADTIGYKRSSVEFTDLVLPGGRGSGSSAGLYESGSVVPHTRQSVTDQGTFRFTTSTTDLAIDGNGFFVVNDSSGTPLLTRSGAFVPDDEGVLRNSAGFALQGYPIMDGQTQSVANGSGGLVSVSISSAELSATPSTLGRFAVNLPSATPINGGSLPSANLAGTTFDEKSSLTTYDNLGNAVIVDVYMTKNSSNTWEMTIFNQADAAAAGAPFPYSSGPLTSETLIFSTTDGKLTPASPSTLNFTIPGGSLFELNVSETTQLGADYIVAAAAINGNSPSSVESVSFDSSGTLFAGYSNGSLRPLYRIPIATVISPDQLAPVSGTAFAVSPDSGNVTYGFANEGKAGRVMSSTLEQSNVDIADELIMMIQSQRGYSANSKVFQTGTEVTEIAINLKR